MRTTLKRGVGRGANGNGAAVLPPGVLSPVTRYRQPERKRSIWRSLARIFVLVLVICSSLIFGAAGGVYLDAVVLVNQGKDSDGNDRTPTRWQTRITGRIAENAANREGGGVGVPCAC